MSTLSKKAKEKRKKRNRFKKFLERGRCRWCDRKKPFKETVIDLDYKNLDLMTKLITMQGKLHSRKRSGACAKHQQFIKHAVKRARFMGFLPYRS